MDQEVYKTGNQLRREQIKQKHDETAAAIGALLLVGLVTLGAITFSKKKRVVAGVGQARQLAIDFDEQQHRADIEQAFAQMQERQFQRRRADMFRRYPDVEDYYYVDRETGDEYPMTTIFELYSKNRYNEEPMKHIRDIEGEELELLSETIHRYMDKARTFGYTLYLYQDGALVDTFND